MKFCYQLTVPTVIKIEIKLYFFILDQTKQIQQNRQNEQNMFQKN